MNKKILYVFVAIIGIVSSVVGGSLAYYVAVARTPDNSSKLGANKFNVLVDTDGPIDGSLVLALNKDSGLSTGVKIKMDSDSVLSKARLYFNVNDISNNTINGGSVSWKKALKWELYGYNASNTWTLLDSGNFLECSSTGTKTCVNGDKLYIGDYFQLTYEYQEFDVYVWLDGEIADNGVKGAYIKANVSAETEEFSAGLR